MCKFSLLAPLLLPALTEYPLSASSRVTESLSHSGYHTIVPVPPCKQSEIVYEVIVIVKQKIKKEGLEVTLFTHLVRLGGAA